MTIYTVHVPPSRRMRAGTELLRAVFVKEGFCWPGLFLTLPWLVFRGMWIAAALYVVAMAGAAYLGLREAALVPIAVGAVVFLRLLIGLEGNDLRRWSLGLRGYEFDGVVAAASRAEAEIRYFARPPEPPPVPASVAAEPVAPRGRPLLPSPSIVGMFPSPEGAP